MTLSTDTARAQAIEILGCSIFHAKNLKESLEEERDALESQDMEALMRAIRDKSIRVNELQTLDRKRSELCSEAGFTEGPEQMSDFTDWCDADEEIAHNWGQLIELAHACNTMNLTNGAVIRMRKQMVEDGISLLRGHSTETNTYNRDGARRDGAGHRPIAEA